MVLHQWQGVVLRCSLSAFLEWVCRYSAFKVGDLRCLIKQFHEAFRLAISTCLFWGYSMMVKSLCFSELCKLPGIKLWSVLTFQQLSWDAIICKICFELFFGWLKSC